jgi:hypothetical protein
MGLFKKRSGMIDVVDMQRRGLIKLPARKPSSLKAGKDGFVELASSNVASDIASTSAPAVQSEPAKEEKSGGWFGTFFGGSDATPSQTAATPQFSTEHDGYSKREVDAKIEELDNKVYKLEQRLEVLERKNSVGSW